MSFQKNKKKPTDQSRGPRSSRAVEDPTRELQKTIYELLEAKDYSKVKEIIDDNMELVYTCTQKGLVSLFLRYAIITKDEPLITSLIPRLTMKRDFLSLILYNHPEKFADNIILFSKINVELLDSNDIKFIVENRLSYLLPLLEGKFVKANIPRTTDPVPELRYTPLMNIDMYIDKLILLCKNKSEIDKFVKCIMSKNYDIVVDGGNILHSRNGTIQPQDLIELTRHLTSVGLKPLVVIYPKHLKEHRDLLKIPDLCASPYGDSDDYYILLAYLLNLKRQVITHIITNDEYQDHVLHLNDGLNVNSDFSGHMRDDQIRYTNIQGVFNIYTQLKKHSNCLQIIDGIAYIPTDDGGFIRVVL